MRRRRRNLRRRLRALLCVAGIVAPLLLVGGGATTASSTAPVAIGTLTGTTTIEWTGNKGLVLATARQVIFPDQGGLLLFVEGGTYASVSILSTLDSDEYCGQGNRCQLIHLIYLSELGFGGPSGSGTDHYRYSTGYPPTIPGENLGKPIELYLMTDGRARLVLRPNGYSGSSSYVTGGRIMAHVQKLPVFCASQFGCDQATGYAGMSEVGGATHDLGPRRGMAAVLAYYNYSPEESGDVVAESQVAGTNVCMYPNARSAPQASSEPADYPGGCMLAPQHADDARESFEVLEGVVDGLGSGLIASPTVAVGSYLYDHSFTGRKYLGYQAVGLNATPDLHVHGAYGMWWNYGITDPGLPKPRPRHRSGPGGPASPRPVVPAGALPATGLPPYFAFGAAAMALAIVLRRFLCAR